MSIFRRKKRAEDAVRVSYDAPAGGKPVVSYESYPATMMDLLVEHHVDLGGVDARRVRAEAEMYLREGSNVGGEYYPRAFFDLGPVVVSLAGIDAAGTLVSDLR